MICTSGGVADLIAETAAISGDAISRRSGPQRPRLHVVTTLCCWTAGGDPLRLGQQATLAVPSRNRSQSSP